MAKQKGNPHAWMALISMCLTALYVGGIGWNCISLYAEPIISEWGITRTAFSVVVLILSSCNTIVSVFFYGQIASRFPLRKMILVGGILNRAAFVVFSFAQNVGMLYAGAAMFGFGISMTSNNTYNVACTRWFKKNQSLMISIVATVSSVVGIVFATIVAFWINSVGWRGSFLITFGINAVCTLLGVILYKGDPDKLGEQPMYADEVTETKQETAAAEDGISFQEMLKTPQGWMLIAGWLLIGIAGYIVQGNLALFASDFGYGSYSGTLLSVCLASCAIFMPIGGRICDKFSSKAMVFIGMIAVVINCVILRMPSVPLPLLYLVAVIAGFSWDANIVPVASSIIEAFGNKEFQKKTGIFVGMQAFGVALAPTILNLFYDFGGGTYDLGLLVMAAFAVIVMILFVFGTRPAKGYQR